MSILPSCKYPAFLLAGLVFAGGFRPVAHAATPTAPSRGGSIAGDCSAALARSGLPAGSVSYFVTDVRADRALAAHRADATMIPASNAKVVTTGAALETLGTDFAFRTHAVLDESVSPPRLWIVGSGDPALGDTELRGASPEFAIGALMDAWIDRLRARGIGRLGELVVDDRIFDRTPIPPGWPTEQYGNGYCAETWGLNAHRNTVDIVACRRGGSVALELSPAYGLRVVRNAAAFDAKAKFSIAVARPPSSNDLSVRGRLDRERSQPLELTVHDTPSLVAELAARACRARGIEVATARTARMDDPAADGVAIEPVHATPIATILERANTDSENLYAEALFKRAGAASANAADARPGPGWNPGTWERGRTTVEASLERRIGRGAMAEWRIADGSGLGRDNRVTAEGVGAWLASFARDSSLAPTYFGSFAIAGRTGTVRRRFEGLGDSPVEVRCKTGYIRGVSCLSGLAVAPDGRSIAFSVLANGLEAGDRVARAKALQEAIVRRIVAELEPGTVPAAGGR